MTAPTWISLCCGLDATACRAMAGRFFPVPRMGGKRAYADGILELLGDVPRRFLMVDADPAVVLLWSAVFGGWLDAVAEVIRAAPLDGEDLWQAWKDEPVPADPVEALARWVVLQKGNFSAKPVSMGATFGNVSGFNDPGNVPAEYRLRAATVADRLVEWSGLAGCRAGPSMWGPNLRPGLSAGLTADAVAEWSGLAGFKSVSHTAEGSSHVIRDLIAQNVGAFPSVQGAALLLDLNASSPVARPGDLLTIDPPYRGTTAYRSGLHRERVVELAEEAHEAGARVLVHEAEPVIEGGPWRAVELQRTSRGKQRTWSKQQAEVATINFEPKGQRRLFG